MRIISRYLLTEFMRFFLLTLAGFTAVYLVIDFFEKIDNFLEAGLGPAPTALFFLLSLPKVLLYITPVAVLVAVLVSMGLLARRSELIALKAGGVSLHRASLPIILAAGGISLILFMLSDMVLPPAAQRANRIWNVKVEGQVGPDAAVQKKVWFIHQNAFYHYGLYDKSGPRVEDLEIFRFDERFRLRERVEARAAIHTAGRWVLLDGLVKRYPDGGGLDVAPFERLPRPLPKPPVNVARLERLSEEMSTGQLGAWISSMSAGGYDPLRYIVDLHLKFAYPFICVIMAVLGLPIAFWKERGGGIAVGVAVGVGLAFVYLVFLSLSRSLGYSGLLPPPIAAWLPNLTFLLLGLYLFTMVRQ